MLNRMEGLIRSFDPCLSCSTHADGTMALAVDVLDAEGNLQQRISREP
jgi:NAD-reducing hydrogenase large subunit